MAETATFDPTVKQVMETMGVDNRLEEAGAMLGAEARYLGETVINGQMGPTWRAYAGTEAVTAESDGIGRGGWRIHLYDGNPETGKKGVETLASSMERKFRMRGLKVGSQMYGLDGQPADTRGYGYRGAKALTMMDARTWDINSKISAAHQAMRLMHDHPEGPLDNYMIDGWAGDLGTNNPRIMDALANEVADLNPEDAYAWAISTGKSLEHGGNPFRPEATGFGLFVALRERMRQRGEDSATIAIQGAGAVGIWLAHHAQFSRRDGDPIINVVAMSDRDGMVFTEDPSGLVVPFETAQQLGDAAYVGPKTIRLAAEAEQRGLSVSHRAEDTAPNGKNILTYRASYIAPCALPGVINGATAPHLGAERGSIGGANNDTTQDGYDYNRTHRPQFEEITGEVANSEGTHVSIIEREANIRTVEMGIDTMPSREQTMAMSEAGMVHLMQERQHMAEQLGTTDGRLMAAGLLVANMFPDVINLRKSVLAKAA